MRLEKNELQVTKAEACLLACKLRGQVPQGFIPDDPDTPEWDESQGEMPDLASCAASFLENGGAICALPVDKKVVAALKSPPVETAHNPPRTKEPQAGNPTEPERRKVLEGDSPMVTQKPKAPFKQRWVEAPAGTPVADAPTGYIKAPASKGGK